MNRNEEVNTEVLLQDVDKINKEKENLQNILNELKNKNEVLKEYWVTQTSEEVFSNFHGFYKLIEEIISDLEEDSKFLNKDVIEPYLTFEEKASNTIESELRD